LRFQLQHPIGPVPARDAETYALGVADHGAVVDDETRLRADARRNLARVLEAASELFAAEGDGVSMEAIARRAGVGVGTIYRRFPTKKALGEAIIADHLGAVYREVAAAAQAVPVEGQFCAAVTVLVDRASTHIDLKETLGSAGVDFEAAAAPVFEEIRNFLATLLRHAQDAGSIRADVTIDDVVGLATGACMAGLEHGASSPMRLIGFALDGLRAQPTEA
jgi:AcrR family transcriptional regulator